VVGQPSLANLADDYFACKVDAERNALLCSSGWGVADKKLVVFISEPVEKDQGADERSKQFRGYTEKTVLSLLARCLQPLHDQVQVGLVPHPREDAEALAAHWKKCRGRLSGGRLAEASGRRNVFLADGVCGMASLLLYEAMLLGKPVLSLQPDLRVPQLDYLHKKGVEFFVTDHTTAAEQIVRWAERLRGGTSPPDPATIHSEMNLHRSSPVALADLLERYGNETHQLRRAKK
jgi:hypothetical protein